MKILKKIGFYWLMGMSLQSIVVNADFVDNHYRYLWYLSGIGVDLKDDRGRTALFSAVIDNDIDDVRALCLYGADVDMQDNSGDTPLHLAVEYHNNDMVIELLNEGANVNIPNNNDRTVLNLAIIKGFNELIPLLIENSADINLRNQRGNTLLHEAALYNNFGAVQLLVGQGVDVTLKNNDGQTALVIATCNENHLMIKLLQDAQDAQELKDVQAKKALKYAFDQNVLKYLESKEFLQAQKDINLNILDEASGDSLLHVAARYDKVDLVQFLLAAGVDVTVKNNDGDTALSIAKRNNNERIMQLLKDALDKRSSHEKFLFDLGVRDSVYLANLDEFGKKVYLNRLNESRG